MPEIGFPLVVHLSKSPEIQDLFRRDGRRVFASLVRLLGSFDLAEEALQNAFVAATEQWPQSRHPAQPGRLADLGRAVQGDRPAAPAAPHRRLGARSPNRSARWPTPAPPLDEREAVEDDRLRLIFTCCHPALSEEACVALTLREVCGLTTEAIAHACLIAPTTLAQRIVRAKAKIRDAGIPFEVPEGDALPARLHHVLRVVYLVFNEGYSASQGDDLMRQDLAAEAIRLARLLRELLPEPEVLGLLALMLLQDSRRAARATAAGDLIPLDDQDRAPVGPRRHRRGRGAGARGARLAAVRHLQPAGRHRRGPCRGGRVPRRPTGARSSASTTRSPRIEPSPVVLLNRAVAVAMRDGPEAGLALVGPLIETGGLDRYHLAHAVKADLLRRTGHNGAARDSYAAALELTRQEPERRLLQRRMAELDGTEEKI